MCSETTQHDRRALWPSSQTMRFFWSEDIYAMPWRAGQSLIGTMIVKFSWEGNPARRTAEQRKWQTEVLEESQGGPHNTVKPQRAICCDKGGKVGLQHACTPTVSGLPGWSLWETVSLQEVRKVLKLHHHPWLNTRQTNAMVATTYSAAWSQAGGESDPPSPWASVGRHPLSSILTRKADRVI